MKRKSFQPLDGKDNPQFLEDGHRIYRELREKYPENSHEHLDNILNGLCVSLTIVALNHVDEDNRKGFIQLIWKILNANIG